jgi:hypothetical protein
LFISVTAKSKAKNKKNLKAKESKNKGVENVSTKPVHVNEMILGNINSNVPDRSPMWKNFSDNRYNRPYMHGVVGPQWNVPAAEKTDGFDIISSPMPKPDLTKRIIAADLPPRTYTPTSFDKPLRKDVIQVNIPTQVVRTREESSDPRLPTKRPVSTISGTLYHGTGSLEPKVIHGTVPNFIEKVNSKSKKNKKTSKRSGHKSKKGQNACRGRDFLIDDTRNLRTQGLGAAKEAYSRSGLMLESIEANPKMVLDVQTTNKKEKPDYYQYENNKHLQARIHSMRRTLHGVKAAHTLRKFGR